MWNCEVSVRPQQHRNAHGLRKMSMPKDDLIRSLREKWWIYICVMAFLRYAPAVNIHKQCYVRSKNDEAEKWNKIFETKQDLQVIVCKMRIGHKSQEKNAITFISIIPLLDLLLLLIWLAYIFDVLSSLIWFQMRHISMNTHHAQWKMPTLRWICADKNACGRLIFISIRKNHSFISIY